MLSSEFFECCIDDNPAHPSFKRTFILVMDEIFEYLYKAFLKNIPCLIVITGILKTNGIQLRSMASVQQFLISSAACKATFYNIYYVRQGPLPFSGHKNI
jgi:hypothetical protein